MRRLGWIVFGLLLLVGGRGQAQTDADGLPYIYYYDNRQEAFVIERIDGTDTRLLGQGTMGTGEDAPFRIDGPGWSPSGEWFAWRAAPFRVMSYGDPLPYVISADDRQPIKWNGVSGGSLAWAPDADLLLVSTSTMHEVFTDEVDWSELDYSQSYEDFNLALWDMQHEQPLFERNMRFIISPFVGFAPARGRLQWTADGQFAMLVYSEPVAELPEDDPEGVAIIHYLILRRSGEVLREGILPAYPESAISPYGEFEISTPDGLAIQNLLTCEQYPLPNKLWGVSKWSPDGSQALIFDNERILWLYQDGTFTLVAEGIKEGRWATAGTSNPAWSPSGLHVAVVDDVGSVYLIDTITASVETVVQSSGYRDGVSRWNWLDDGRLMLVPESNEKPIVLTIYDPVTQRRESIDGAAVGGFVSGTQYALSADARYLAYIVSGAIIYDRETNMVTQYSPDSDTYDSSAGEVMWIDDWLMTWADSLVAGGGTFREVGVQRVGSRDYRHLTHLNYYTSIGANVLPPHVSVESLPSPLSVPLRPQPVETLHGNQWMFQMAWSPDGQQLIGGESPYWDHKILIEWDVATGMTAARPAAEMQQGMSWVQDADSAVYHPTFVELPMLPADMVQLWGVSSDGKRIVVSRRIEQDNRLIVMDSVSGETIHDFGEDLGWQGSASFSPDGRYLALGFRWHPAQIWDTTTWQVVGETPYAAQGVAFSPDGQYLGASGGWDVYIWRVQDLLGDS